MASVQRQFFSCRSGRALLGSLRTDRKGQSVADRMTAYPMQAASLVLRGAHRTGSDADSSHDATAELLAVYAHSLPGHLRSECETLDQHATQVAAFAHSFADAFGAGDWGEVLGRLLCDSPQSGLCGSTVAQQNHALTLAIGADPVSRRSLGNAMRLAVPVRTSDRMSRHDFVLAAPGR